MPRLRLDIAYLGAKFAGWQLQAHANAPQPRTVQGVLEEAVARIAGQHCRVQGASRTDAGVHALGQVAHVDIPQGREQVDWQLALNGNLPKDLAITAATLVPDDFHARFSSKSKIYTYSLWCSRRYVLPTRRFFVWRVGPLDWDAMDRAAEELQGRRDFESFRNQGCAHESTVRTLFSIRRKPANDLEMVFTFHGDGFLKQMVRNIMGCLVEVGLGKLNAQAVATIRDGRDRTKAPVTAPAQGLTLQRIFYEEAPEISDFHAP